MALGDIEVSIVTVRYETGPAREYVVLGGVSRLKAQCDKAVKGNGKMAATDANTRARITIDLNAPGAETYSVKPGKLR